MNLIRKAALIFFPCLSFIFWALWDIPRSSTPSQQIVAPTLFLFNFFFIGYVSFKTFFSNKANLYFILLFITYLVSNFVNINNYDSDVFYKLSSDLFGGFIWCSVFYIIQYIVQDSKDANYFLRWLHLSGLLISSSVIAGFTLFNFFGIVWGEVVDVPGSFQRVFGPLGDQVGFIVVFFGLWDYKQKKWLLLLLHLLAVVFTGTKAAIFCMVLGIVVQTILDPVINKNKQFSFGSLFSVIFFFGIFIYVATSIPALNNYMYRITSSEEFDDGFQKRTTVLALAYKVVEDNPLFGVGYSGFKKQADEYGFHEYFDGGQNNDFNVQQYYSNTTNQFLEVFTNGGVFSFVAYLFFLFFLFKNGTSLLRRVGIVHEFPVILPIFVYLLVLSLGNHTAVYLINGGTTGLLYLMLAGFTIRLTAIADNQQFFRKRFSRII